MNKYQKALKDIKYIIDTNDEYWNNDAISILQELVDKETPKKPLDNGNHKGVGLFAKCPNCNKYLRFGFSEYEPDYCSECGQKLDLE